MLQTQQIHYMSIHKLVILIKEALGIYLYVFLINFDFH